MACSSARFLGCSPSKTHLAMRAAFSTAATPSRLPRTLAPPLVCANPRPTRYAVSRCVRACLKAPGRPEEDVPGRFPVGNMTSTQKLVVASLGVPASAPDGLDAVPVQPIALEVGITFVGEDGHLLAILSLPGLIKFSDGDTDADRSNRVVVIKAGTATLSKEFWEELIIAQIKANTAGTENAIIYTHCQNVLGLTSANTLVLEVTSSGKSRNASLEEVQEHSGLQAQTQATVGANAIARESGIHEDLNGMGKLKGSSQTTTSGEGSSTHENEFDNGNLSGSHAARTELVKPPPTLESRQHTMTRIVKRMVDRLRVYEDIIRIVKQSAEFLKFMWQKADQCLRFLAFFGIGFTLAVGFAAVYYGMMVILKAVSKSHSA